MQDENANQMIRNAQKTSKSNSKGWLEKLTKNLGHTTRLKSLIIYGSRAWSGFALRPQAEKSQLCQSMVLPELEYTKRLFKKQWPGWSHFYG